MTAHPCVSLLGAPRGGGPVCPVPGRASATGETLTGLGSRRENTVYNVGDLGCFEEHGAALVCEQSTWQDVDSDESEDLPFG